MSDVTACQFEPVVGDVEANLATIETFCESLSSADVVVFPELSLSGYAPEVAADVAEPIPGPLTDPLVDVADRTDSTLVVGLPERAEGRCYNAVALVDGDGVRTVYRKQHLWTDEIDRFAAGTECVVAETALGRVGFLVGYDLNFPELALEYADRGCDVLVTVAAWQTAYASDWTLLSRVRALDTPAFLVGSGQTGRQGTRTHAGHSLVVGPRGTVIAEAGDEQASVTATIDPDELWTARNYNPVRQTRDRPRGTTLQSETCPQCGDDLEHRSGTIICQSCNWHPRYPTD